MTDEDSARTNVYHGRLAGVQARRSEMSMASINEVVHARSSSGSVLAIVGLTMIVTFVASLFYLRPFDPQHQFSVFHTTGKFDNNTIDHSDMSGYSSMTDAGEITGNRVTRTKMSSGGGDAWRVSFLVAVSSGLVVEAFRRIMRSVFPEQP